MGRPQEGDVYSQSTHLADDIHMNDIFPDTPRFNKTHSFVENQVYFAILFIKALYNHLSKMAIENVKFLF